MLTLADWCIAHRRRVIVAWLAVAVLTTVVAGTVGRRYATDYTLPGTESQRASDLLAREFRGQSGDIDTIVSWLERVAEAGIQITPVIDRDYFLAIYFRQPHGILFGIATTSPGFAVDEDPDHLGEELRLPKQHEHLRPLLEHRLTPACHQRAHAL